jgi:hypothetical protein
VTASTSAPSTPRTSGLASAAAATLRDVSEQTTYRVSSVPRQISQIAPALKAADMTYEITNDYTAIFARATSPDQAIERVAFLLQLSDHERAALTAEPEARE